MKPSSRGLIAFGIAIAGLVAVIFTADRIQAVPGTRVMVVACAGRPLVLPYEEK